MCLASLLNPWVKSISPTFANGGFKTFMSSKDLVAEQPAILPELFSKNLGIRLHLVQASDDQLCLVEVELIRTRKNHFTLELGMHVQASTSVTFRCAEACSFVMCCVQLCQPFVTPWTRVLCPWNFSGKNAGVGCHFFLQKDLPHP